MFSFFSISNVKKKCLFVGFVLLLAFMFGSCDDGNTDEGVLTGTWEAEYDSYIITAETIEYPSDFGDGFKGKIESVTEFNGKSGVIIYKYTEPPTYKIYGTDDDFYISGKDYNAVYYQNLTSSTVQLANVINLTDYSSEATATLNEAIAKFTLGNVGNFVDWGIVNPYTKK